MSPPSMTQPPAAPTTVAIVYPLGDTCGDAKIYKFLSLC